MRPGPRQGEAGSTTAIVPFFGILVLVLLALAFQGGVLVAERRAQAAADLAALAGASAAQRGEDACGAASRMAALNAARIASCAVDGAGGREVVVSVERDGPVLWGREITVRASARGGPDPP